MGFFGGQLSSGSGAVTNDGARYDPSLDAWLSLPPDHVPSPRFGHAAVWVGSGLVIFGGAGPDGDDPLSDGAVLDL